MEFIIEKDAFIKVLHKMQGIVEKRNTMPILANILIEADKGSKTVSVTGTDLEIFIKDSTGADVKKDGSITINARKFFEIIKELPEQKISVKLGEGEKVTIKSGKARFNVVGLPAKEFPPFPSSEDKLHKVDGEAIKDMIDKTSFSVSTDETRYNINGFMLENKDGTARMVTTDGHRLAMIEKESGDIPGGEDAVIMPKKGVMELRRLLEEKDGDILFGVGKKNAVMKKETATINIRLIEGEFPDYKQVIPKDNDKRVEANREKLLGSLRRVSLLSSSSDKVKNVKFSVEKSKLTLSSSSPEMGDATEEVDVVYDGESLEIAFNARYFIDALEAVDDEEVAIILKDHQNPAILNSKEDGGYTYIIMPMRLL